MSYNPEIHERAILTRLDIQAVRERAKLLGWREAKINGPSRLLRRVMAEWLAHSSPEPEDVSIEARLARLERRLGEKEQN